MLRLLLISILTLSALSGWSQANKILKSRKPVHHYAINQWSTQDGLASNTINQVFQSSDGYLWVTSFNGLFRFDGINFEANTIDNLDFLNSNGFYNIYQNSSGVVFFLTQASGIITYQNNEFAPFLNTNDHTPSVRSMYEDQDGKIWIGTNNNGLWIVENDSLRRVEYGLLNTSTIYAVTEGLAGEILVGTVNEGLVAIKNNSLIFLSEDLGHPNVSIKCFEWMDDLLLIGTTSGYYTYKEGILNEQLHLKGVEVNDIEIGVDGDIWFATEVGLARINGDEVEFFTESEGLPSRQISSLMFDDEENLWMSTKKSGLLRLTYANFTNITTDDGLALNRVNAIYGSPNGEILVGSDNGDLDIIKNSVISSYPLSFDLDNISIKDILIDKSGSLLLATYAGLIKKRGAKSKLYAENEGMPDIQARVLHEDSEGYIWVGFKNNGLAKITEKGIITFNHSNGLGANYILSIDEMDDGTIVVGTHSGGLNFIKNDEVVGIEFPINIGDGVLIFNTYIESDRRIWLTTNVGLFLFNPIDKSFNQISEPDGLIAETVFDVMEDDLGYFWISSNIGIIKLDKKKAIGFLEDRSLPLDAILYDHNDGLASNDCTAAAKIYKTADGLIWIPTLGGIVTVDPAVLSTNTRKPPVHIERICLDDVCNSQFGSEIQISPGTRRYVIEFTSLSYTAPNKVQFKYQLEGFDPAWYDADGRREVVYTNLKPGSYTFNVQASNNDGVWNTQGANISFKIKPFFYQSPWFYASVFALIGGLIYGRIYTIRKHNTQLKKLNTELDSFVYSTSHDLRAPLMSILGLVNIAKLDTDPKRLRDYLENIESSVKKLDRFISDIIDYSRNSRLELIKEKVEISSLIDEVFSSLSYLDPSLKIGRKILVDNEVKEINTDPRRLKIILSNLISNSFRYHKSNGQDPFIDVSVSHKDGEYLIQVADNGQGIKSEQQSKIFDMFYRASENSNGSGLGLYIVKETAEKLGGLVEVQSTFDVGSAFTVHIPVE